MARFLYDAHLRWSDMDPYQHVNNTVYFAYLEQARVGMMFDSHHSGIAGFRDGIVIAHNEIDYLRPVVYHPEPLRIELWVEDIRGASFTVRYEVYDSQTLAARAMTSCVRYDFASDRPQRLSEDEREVLTSYLDDPVHAG